MSKEKIQEKITAYQSQLEQLKANLNALSGAIQALQQLLQELEAEEKVN